MCSISVGKHPADVNLCGFIMALFQPGLERNVKWALHMCRCEQKLPKESTKHSCSQNSLEDNKDSSG